MGANEKKREEKRRRQAARKEEENGGEPKRSVLGDSSTMKRLLDDAAIKVLLDEDGPGYEEDTGLSNVKLVVGFAGVAASLLSHVYPATFPRNWWVLLWCCAFYFAMSGVLQLLLSFVELESILLTRGKAGASGKRGNGFNLSSHFPRFQEVYTLGVTPLPRGSLGLAWSPKFNPAELEPADGVLVGEPGFVQQAWSVAQFFDGEGYFLEEAFAEAMRAFFKECEGSLEKEA